MTTDWVARLVAGLSLLVASGVGLIACLTYWRGRHQAPNVALDAAAARIVIRKPNLVVMKVRLLNRSYQPNTIVEVEVYAARLPLVLWRVGRNLLKVRDCSLAHSIIISQGGVRTKAGLSVAPGVQLSKSDWEQLLSPSGGLLQEAVWQLPLYLREVTQRNMLVAVGSEKIDLAQETRLVFVLKDIMGVRHQATVKLE